jgi:hypothetical protein
MTRRVRIVSVAALAVAIGAGAAGAAVALGGDDDRGGDDADVQVTGPAAARAGDAALARFPGGRVTGIEREGEEADDGDAAWEVEITRSDVAHVDVDLDQHLRILAVDDPE